MVRNSSSNTEKLSVFNAVDITKSWVRHAYVNHVFWSLLKDSVPFTKVGMGPEMNTLWLSHSVSFFFSEPVFFRRMPKDPVWMMIFRTHPALWMWQMIEPRSDFQSLSLIRMVSGYQRGFWPSAWVCSRCGVSDVLSGPGSGLKQLLRFLSALKTMWLSFLVLILSHLQSQWVIPVAH